VLVRSWNLYHGRTVPLGRRAYLADMIRLATADEPDILCVQEVPAWALPLFTVGHVASRPPLGATLGRLLTSLHHGRLRAAVSGQGNAILVAPHLRVVDRQALTLNPRRFRTQQGLGRWERLAWAKERRIVQTARLSDGTHTFVVANTHLTGRFAEAELTRAAWFADSVARPGEPLVFAGDFNLTPESEALQALTGPEWGFSAPGPGIDHILVRGAAVSETRVWPVERRRRLDGRLLSDHAPVEVDVELG
jgi:endonuclease/exonuclease/phosphatase family metal-dependent hydrolase